MPFPEQSPRQFTRQGIESLNPNQYGCYGIYRPGQWIYVGMGDIRERLLDHLNGRGNPHIHAQRPTHFVAVVTNNAESMEKTLIAELRPVCNMRVG
ncbi:MAG: hypothetical protein AB7O77_09905 [Phycisphaerales bacterium]